MGAGVIDQEKNIANIVVKGNPRIQLMKEHLFKEKRQISLERALFYTESYRQTEGEETILRRAKAVAHILANVEISIRTGELLVGNRTVRPRSGILSPEMDPYWIMEEIDTIATRPQDQFEFTEADKKIYREDLYPYWKKRSMKDFINGELTEEVTNALKDDVFKLNQTDKGQGHIIMDFPGILSRGLGGYLDLLDRKINQEPENHFYQAGKIIFSAMQDHFLRYADLAEVMSSQEKMLNAKKSY